MSAPIKIIDLFAGPGGLGEGFSACKVGNRKAFKIAISIEKETSAHRTLLLRALFRQFPEGKVPECYYDFLRGNMGKNPEEQLYKHPEIAPYFVKAQLEAQQITLGETPPREVYKKIRDSLNTTDECILIGGPPCQAYSLVGRSRNYGAKDKAYDATEDHRNFLYKEYLKVIAKFQPKVFVMENVKGMLSAKVGGELIFPSIRRDLQDPCGSTNTKPDGKRKKHKYKLYSFVTKENESAEAGDLFDNSEPSLKPKDFIIKAENCGIPQARHRVILLGVRSDVADTLTEVPLLDSKQDQLSVKNVISDLPKLRSKLSKEEDSGDNWQGKIQDIPKSLLKVLSNDPLVSSKMYETYTSNSQRVGIADVKESTGSDKGLTKKLDFDKELPTELRDWYHDSRMKDAVINHETRGHIVGDLHRYLYYSTFAKLEKRSPNAHNLPKALWPAHKNFGSGKFADRFRVQTANAPGTTVTSHISKDGHYFIHYDPRQCRSLTVREAARLQTFPDNYYFVGNRTQQYVQVGNAVPPYLAKQLAQIVSDIIKNK